MIRAAIDARGSFPGIVVACEDVCLPGRINLWLAETVQLVEYEALEKPRMGKDKAIVLSEARLARRVAEVMSKLMGAGVQRLVIERPSKRSHSVAFVEALVAAASGLVVEIVHAPWPEPGERDDGKDLARKHFADWPDDGRSELGNGWSAGDFKGTRDAARVWLFDAGIVAREAIPSDPVKEFSKGPAPAPPPSRIEPQPLEQVHLAPTGTRVLAIDTGRHIGVVVAEPLPDGRWRQLLARTLTLDPTDQEHRRDFIEGLAKIVREYKIQRAVIEMVSGVHGGRGEGLGVIAQLRAVASMLAQANWIGGGIEVLCWTAPAPLEVRTASAGHWRRSLLGGKTTPSDEQVEELVRTRFANWPIVSTKHDRDAAGLLLWDAGEEAKPPRAKRAPSKSSSSAAQRERKVAARAAAGCECPLVKGGRHDPACPIWKPRKPRTWKRPTGVAYMCPKCGQPKKGHVCTGKEEALQ